MLSAEITKLRQYLLSEYVLFIIWAIFAVFCISTSVYYDQAFLKFVPFAIPLAYMIFLDYRNLFYLFFFILPFSIEVDLPGGFATDLPSEPLMLIMTGLSLMLFAYNLKNIDLSVLYQPITVILILHIVWIGVTAVLSGNTTISFKFFLAKIWYIIPFYFFAIHILKNDEDILKIAKAGIWTLLLAMIYVLVRHAMEGFTFESCNTVVRPIFRNHVNYASNLVVFLPFIWALYAMERKPNMRKIYLTIMLITVVAIYFSYTRAAILCIIIALGAYYIVKHRWVKPVLIVAVFALAQLLAFLSYNNNYLRFAPNYESTITHDKFNNLIEATYKMEDLSTMERVYRWVAGAEMIKEKPWTGFGPGCFYSFYKAYTISSFQTYVSDNPDKSSVHCYYLLVWIDQGIIGFIILIVLVLVTLVIGEKVYHSLAEIKDRILVMAAMMSYIIILSINLINDMIETDKVGPFFFLNAAIITIYAIKTKISYWRV